jgi:soluble lytic murein transglycosylase-like protein
MLKNMTGTEFALILLCGMFFLGFFGIAFAVYDLRHENKNLQTEVSEEKEKLLRFSLFWSGRQKETMEQLVQLSNRTQMLEASLTSQETRWAKIKLVRDIVKKHQRAGLTISQITDIAAAIVDMSEQHDVSISLLLAVAKQESAFNIRAHSSAGALGIMQVMPHTAADIAIELNKRRYSLFNSRQNIEFGSYYLWKMLDRFNGNIDLAVKAYNAGPTFVEKVNSKEWVRKFECKWSNGTITKEEYYCETADYGRKVLEYKSEFEKLGI